MTEWLHCVWSITRSNREVGQGAYISNYWQGRFLNVHTGSNWRSWGIEGIQTILIGYCSLAGGCLWVRYGPGGSKLCHLYKLLMINFHFCLRCEISEPQIQPPILMRMYIAYPYHMWHVPIGKPHFLNVPQWWNRGIGIHCSGRYQRNLWASMILGFAQTAIQSHFEPTPDTRWVHSPFLFFSISFLLFFFFFWHMENLDPGCLSW